MLCGIPETLIRHAQDLGEDRVCLTEGSTGDTWTYSRFLNCASLLADDLLAQPIDGVVLVLVRSATRLATSLLGGLLANHREERRNFIMAPLGIHATNLQVEEMVRLIRPAVLVVDHDLDPLAASAAATAVIVRFPSDSIKGVKRVRTANSGSDFVLKCGRAKQNQPWLMMHTSGSTKKKFVLRSERSVLLGALVHQDSLKLTRDDVLGALWPMSGISSWFFTFTVLYFGGSVVYLDPFVSTTSGLDKVHRALSRSGATFSTCAPRVMRDLLKFNDFSDEKWLPRIILLSGAACAAHLKQEIEVLMRPTGEVWEAYGSTEAGIVTLASKGDAGVGKPPIGCPSVRIDSESHEIMVSVHSPMFMLGYYDAASEGEARASSTADPDWFRSGDVGRLDASGCLLLEGRLDDRLNTSSGMDFYPYQVESVLEAIKGVRNVFVTSLGSGEPIWAAAVLAEGAARESTRSALERAAHELPPHMRPARYAFFASLEELPLTETNKIMRPALARQLSRTFSES